MASLLMILTIGKKNYSHLSIVDGVIKNISCNKVSIEDISALVDLDMGTQLGAYGHAVQPAETTVLPC